MTLPVEKMIGYETQMSSLFYSTVLIFPKEKNSTFSTTLVLGASVPISVAWPPLRLQRNICNSRFLLVSSNDHSSAPLTRKSDTRPDATFSTTRSVDVLRIAEISAVVRSYTVGTFLASFFPVARQPVCPPFKMIQKVIHRWWENSRN